VVIANFFQVLALTVDLAFVGGLGATPLAAAGFATQVYVLALSLATGMATGATALVARSFGAGDPEQGFHDGWLTLVLALAVGIPIAALVVLLAPPLIVLSAGGAPGTADVVDQSARFLAVLALGLPASFLTTAITGAFQGAGDTRPTLTNGLVINAINIVADYCLIFGNFGFPRLGLYGAAFATLFANTVGAILFVLVMARGRRAMRLRVHLPRRERLAALVRLGAPAGAESLLLNLGFTAYLVLILQYGAPALAAHQIGLRIQSFAFTPGMGFSTAAAALVGQALGAGDPDRAERDAWGAMRMALLLMVGGSVPLVVAAPWVAGIFTNDPTAKDLGVFWIRTLVLAIPAIAIHFTVAGALRGAGDTRWPLLVSFIGLWFVRLPLAWFLADRLGWMMPGIWAAYVVEYYVRALVTTLRFRTGRWKAIRL
jgi:putative MATE family efflux protein